MNPPKHQSRIFFAALVVVMVALAGGCVSSTARPQIKSGAQHVLGPHLSTDEVRTIANEKARSVVGNLKDLYPPDIKYHPKSHSWEVFYQDKSHMLDACFTISVNDLTKHASFESCA